MRGRTEMKKRARVRRDLVAEQSRGAVPSVHKRASALSRKAPRRREKKNFEYNVKKTAYMRTANALSPKKNPRSKHVHTHGMGVSQINAELCAPSLIMMYYMWRLRCY